MNDTLQAALEAAERERGEAEKAQREASIAYRAATIRVEAAYRAVNNARRLLMMDVIRERHPAGPTSYECLSYNSQGIPDRRELDTIESYTSTGRARVLHETWTPGRFRDRDESRETLSLAETAQLRERIERQQREGLPPLRKEQA